MRRINNTISWILINLMISGMITGCGADSVNTGGTGETAPASIVNKESISVSYLGPEGTYTEEAAQFFFADGASLNPTTTVPEAIEAVVSGESEYAVIPQENTIGGAVTNYVDALIAETGDKTIAAVASPGAAKVYGLSVLAENVQITDTNKTRFYVLSSARLKAKGQKRAVFVAQCDADRIDDIIVAIHDSGLELVSIHDRPEGSYLGAYYYIIEAENKNGITEGQMEGIDKIPEIRLLGSFDAIEKP